MINPPIKATHRGRPVRVYGTTPDGMVLIAYDDNHKADVALWCDLEIPPEAEIAAVAVQPAPVPPALWAEWVEVNEHVIQRPGIAEDGAKHRQTVLLSGDGSWAWRWYLGNAIFRELGGYPNLQRAQQGCDAYTAEQTAPKTIP